MNECPYNETRALTKKNPQKINTNKYDEREFSFWVNSFRSINAATKSLLVQGTYQTIQHNHKLDTKPNVGSRSEKPAASFY